MRAPVGCRALIRAASWIVPARARTAWLANRYAELFDWWYLVERGEPVGHGGAELCRLAWADALNERFGGVDLRHHLRAPMVVPIAAAASLLVLALVSHGFSVTRQVLEIARDMHVNPRPGQYDGRGDRLMVYAFPLALALTTALTVFAIGCVSLRGRGWRYWAFLALKAISVVTIGPLMWIEVGTMARHLFTAMPGRGLAGLASVILLIVAMGRAMIWCVADQRRRCRTCLRRMVLPVSVGSWASQFEPSATEMLCEQGHGALALSDAETNVQDRWTRLDESWKALFR
jgi:hypothetical protein